MLGATLNSDVLRRVFATLFGVSLVGMLIGGALELGVWPQNQTVRGPFKLTEGSKAIVQPLAAPFFPGLSSGGDTNEQPRRSRLKASINEVPLWPPHTLHAEVISEGGGRYSHWGETLVFSLPSNTQNTESTILQIRYFWRLNSAALWIIAGGLVASTMALLVQAQVRHATWPLSLMRSLYLIGAVACAVVCLPLLVFLLVVGWEVLMGDPQKIAELRRITGERILVAATFIPQALIVAAALVYFFSLGIPSTAETLRSRCALSSKFNRVGGILFLTVLLPATLLLSVARVWGGVFTPIDLLGNMLGGSIPWNDANGHYWGPFQQMWTGSFPEFNMRRPFAACSKSFLALAAGFVPALQIILQAVLLGAALSFAVYRFFVWRGLAAALFFAGVSLNVVLPYSPTHLTEPLGLFWALCAVPAILAGLKPNAVGVRFLALFLIGVGAATRMGNMFLPPCYALWMLYAGSRENGQFAKSLASVAVAFSMVFSANFAAQKLYGSNESPPAGSNFSYVLVGLAYGGNWSLSLDLFSKELQALKSEQEVASFLYQKAWKQIRHHPEIFLGRLWQGTTHFLSNAFSMLLNRQLVPGDRFNPMEWTWLMVLPIALVRTWANSGRKTEDALWFLIVFSSAASAAFVMFDDGWRVLSSALIYCGLAISAYLGFGGKEQREVDSPKAEGMSISSSYVIGALCALFLVFTPLISSALHSSEWSERKPERIQSLDSGVLSSEISPSLRFSPSINLVSEAGSLDRGSIVLAPDAFTRSLVLGGISQYQSLPETLLSSEGATIFVTPLGSTVFARARVIQPEAFKSNWIRIDYDLLSELQGPHFYEATRIVPLE